MPAIYRTKPIPSLGVEVGDVAVAASQQLKLAATASASGAGMAGTTRTVTSRTFIASTDYIVRGDTSSAGFTITLPKVSEYSRQTWRIVRSAGANTLTLAARGSDTINGAASIAVTNMVLVYATNNAAWIATQIG